MRNSNSIVGDQWLPADPVAHELVVFTRHGDSVEVTVRGMTAATGLDVLVCERRRRTEISVLGTPGAAEVRPYELRVSVDVHPDRPTVAVGSDSVEAASLPEDLPVVCGADPTQAGIGREFLHRRGDRYVLMADGDAGGHGPSRHTMVA